MTGNEDHIMSVLNGFLIDDKPLEVRNPRPHRIFVTVPRDSLKKIVKILVEQLGAHHLSTITGRDTGTDLLLLYHFFIDTVEVTVQTSCPRDDATVDSIVDVFPGAVLYEREFHDLLGIVPKKHPDLRRLVLPDDWSGGYPLRKDWKAEGGEQSHG
jgi:NADH:ubiquinone oxidoreductase subunit C